MAEIEKLSIFVGKPLFNTVNINSSSGSDSLENQIENPKLDKQLESVDVKKQLTQNQINHCGRKIKTPTLMSKSSIQKTPFALRKDGINQFKIFMTHNFIEKFN